MYGIDWDAPLSTDDDVDSVGVPATPTPLSSTDYAELCQTIDPIAHSEVTVLTSTLQLYSLFREE